MSIYSGQLPLLFGRVCERESEREHAQAALVTAYGESK